MVFQWRCGNLDLEPHASERPSPQWRHVCLGPSLVDEDKAFKLDPTLTLDPLCPPARDIGTIAFPPATTLFLKLIFSAWTKFQTDR